jgi:hypothetical protein
MAEPTSNPPERIPVNPFWVGGSFLDYCVRQGWMLIMAAASARASGQE